MPSPIPIDHVLRTIATYPEGVSAKDLALKLNMHITTLNARLSRSYLYGKLDREMVRHVPQRQSGPRFHYLYRMKAAQPAE